MAVRICESGTRRDADCCMMPVSLRINLSAGSSRQSPSSKCSVSIHGFPYWLASYRAHTFDNFLAGVAAFGIADVRVLQTGFVRNLFIAKIVAKPGNALFQSQSVQCLVAYCATVGVFSFCAKRLP